MSIIDSIKRKEGFISLCGADNDNISKAENELALAFSQDYIEYVLAYGVAAYNGHELTGICDSKRLNVVDVTLEEKQNNPDVPANYYVVEQANIDGIVIWQSETGEVIQSMPGSPIIKLCNSLCEYIELI